MSTVIVGGGIIGLSIAYYLSDPHISPRREIRVVDSSAQLFASASGFAAGFLARDWFSPEIAPLGELSFELHRKLAEDNDGEKNWGYMKGIALSLQVEAADGQKSKRGDDWLRRGASRAEASVQNEKSESGTYPSPLWLTKQKGETIERIGNDGSTALVDPLRLCQFLLRSCMERGVRVHYPARPVKIIRHDTGKAQLLVQRTDTMEALQLACDKLILAAGAWTPRVFKTLFPKTNTEIPVGALSGYSLVFQSPRHSLEHERDAYAGMSHAVFTTHPKSCGFSPEIFSRQGGEIYIAGLNSLDIPLPEVATDSGKIMEREKMDRVKHAATVLMGRRPDTSTDSWETDNINDLEVVREALCFRPWTDNGRPIICKMESQRLGAETEVVPEVFVATGHGPWGIALSLGTGKVMAEMVCDTKPNADVRSLGLSKL